MPNKQENTSSTSAQSGTHLPLRPEELQLIINIRDAERAGVKLAIYGATRGVLQACITYLGPEKRALLLSS